MRCPDCNLELAVGHWPFCPHGYPGRQTVAVHPSERAVVWENPGTGQVRYPGRNDAPMPARYAAQGFERRELTSLHAVEQFEREKGVRNDKAWHDDGSGRSFTG